MEDALKYYEYLENLQKQYRTTSTELLDELAAAGLAITKGNLSHKLKGQRRISAEELSVIIQTICPTAAEEAELRRLFQINMFGEERYLESELIRRYIAQYTEETIRSIRKLPEIPETGGNLSTPDSVQAAVYAICKRAWGRSCIRVMCQPQFRAMTDMLLNMSADASAEVRHLICFNNDPAQRYSGYNIQCLFSADRLALGNDRYTARFFYDKVDAHINQYSLFPFFITAEDMLLLIAYDCKSGFLVRDPALIRRMTDDFDRIWADSRLLLKRFESEAECLQMLGELESKTKENIYILRKGCYLPAGIGDDEMQRYVSQEIRGAGEMHNIRRRRLKRRKLHFDLLHTIDDTQQFLETGVIPELPAEAEPVPQGAREAVIRRAKQAMTYRSIQNGLLLMPQDFTLVCNDNGSVLLCHLRPNERLCLATTERRLYQSVSSFFQYLIQFGSSPDPEP